MVVAISVILLIIGILFVAYPLFRPLRSKDEERETIEQLHVKQSTIHSILEELEMDYEMGHISDEEYHELDAKYRAQLN